MYNVHPHFSLKNVGKKSVHYTRQTTVFSQLHNERPLRIPWILCSTSIFSALELMWDIGQWEKMKKPSCLDKTFRTEM